MWCSHFNEPVLTKATRIKRKRLWRPLECTLHEGTVMLSFSHNWIDFVVFYQQRKNAYPGRGVAQEFHAWHYPHTTFVVRTKSKKHKKRNQWSSTFNANSWSISLRCKIPNSVKISASVLDAKIRIHKFTLVIIRESNWRQVPMTHEYLP